MNRQYKICFLGYGQLHAIARAAIDSLAYTDTDILLVDCNVETLSVTVDNALSNGYEVFIEPPQIVRTAQKRPLSREIKI